MRPAYYIHPEFGYFWPAPAARREVRVAAVSILFGMAIGAAIITVGTGHAVETEGASSNAQLKSSSPDMGLPRGGEPSSRSKHADDVEANPVEAIKPYPMRIVRVRPTKAASPFAGIPLGRSTEPDPPLEQSSESPADSPAAQTVAAAAEPAISDTKPRASASQASYGHERNNPNYRRSSKSQPR